MRSVVLALLLGTAFAGEARADGYAWGGEIGRVSVHVQLSGFNEGAGVGGWRVEDARWFVAWAAHVEAMLPPGIRAEIGSDEMDGELTLRLVSASRTDSIPLGLARPFPGPDLDPVLDVLARRFRRAIPAGSASPRLYTVQLLAATHGDRATAFARSLDERIDDAGVFYETCLPCWTPVAHVLDPDPHGLYRVVVGVFADRGAARDALRSLRATGLDGFVRTL